MLTWYNALHALGYNPFLDRLSLDAVEKIPQYVRETVTVIIAVTANLCHSYWCAVELCTAVDLHAEGLLHILLVPVQGEVFISPTGATTDFPSAATMMINFDKWFPASDGIASGTTRERIARLYGGGEATSTRMVKHTLYHYKSFERLLIARCGLSLRAHQEMKVSRAVHEEEQNS